MLTIRFLRVRHLKVYIWTLQAWASQQVARLKATVSV